MKTLGPETPLFRLAFCRDFRKYSIPILLADMLLVLVNCVSPLAQQRLIDAADNADRAMVITAAVVVGVLLGLRFLFASLSRWIRGLLTISARPILKAGLFRRLLALPEEYLRSRGAGYFFNRVQNDITEVIGFLNGGNLTVWPEFLKLALAFGMILWIRPECALLTIPFLLLQVFVCLKFRPRQYDLSRQMQECAATERHVMQEFLSGHTTMKTHAVSQRAGDRVETGLRRWSALAKARLVNENWFRTWIQMPIWLCSGIVVVTGLLGVVRKESTLGEVWALLRLLTLVFAPARTLAGVFVQTQSARSAWNRLAELLGQPTEQQTGEAPTLTAPRRLEGDLSFRDVTFGYSPDRPVFDRFNLTIPRGRTLFITGPNGSGKSTLLALLLRLYEPASGEIVIGTAPIRQYSLSDYRSRIGYLGQSPEFIRGTLRENLLLGCRGREDDEILEIFRSLDCANLVTRHPAGLDAPVAERGENFSGGERLRLALVRELLRDTDILLFDEPAAPLDTEGRQRFYTLLETLPAGKTVLAVVHDLPPGAEHILRLCPCPDKIVR